MPINANENKKPLESVNSSVDKADRIALAQKVHYDAYMDFLGTVEEINKTFKFTDLQWAAIKHLLAVHAGYIDAGWELKLAPAIKALSKVSNLD